MSTRRTLPLIAVAAAVVLLGACGSGKSTVGINATAAPAATTATPDTSGLATSAPVTNAGSGGKSSTAPGASTDFCKVGDGLDNSLNTAGDAATAAKQLKDSFTKELPALVEQAKALAPANLRGDVKVIGDALAQATTLFAKYDWDMSKAAADSEFQTLFTSGAFTTASNNINAYCGYSS